MQLKIEIYLKKPHIIQKQKIDTFSITINQLRPKTKNNNFNYPYTVVIPKFHEILIKFRTVTVGCNTYANKAGRLSLTVLTKLYNYTLSNDYKFCIKNSLQLVNLTINLTKINNIKTFDF